MGVIVVSLVQPVTVRHICCTCPEQLDLHRKHRTQAKTWVYEETKGFLKVIKLAISLRKVINNVSPPLLLASPFSPLLCSSKIHKDIQCNQNTSFQQRMSTNCERRGNKSVRSMFHIAILFPVSSYSLLDLWSPVCRLLQFLSPLQSYHLPTAALLLVYLGSCVYSSNLWL